MADLRDPIGCGDAHRIGAIFVDYIKQMERRSMFVKMLNLHGIEIVEDDISWHAAYECKGEFWVGDINLNFDLDALNYQIYVSDRETTCLLKSDMSSENSGVLDKYLDYTIHLISSQIIGSSTVKGAGRE